MHSAATLKHFNKYGSASRLWVAAVAQKVSKLPFLARCFAHPVPLRSSGRGSRQKGEQAPLFGSLLRAKNPAE